MKRVLAGVALLVLAIVCLWLGKILFFPESLQTTTLKDLDVDLNLQGMELSEGRDGKKLWSLSAKNAQYSESDDEIMLTAPFVTYWGKQGEKPVTVQAPHGLVWQKKKEARMWGGVNASTDKYLLRAENLEYNGMRDELVFSSSVSIRGKAMHGNAERLTYFLESGDFFAQGGISVVFFP